VRGAKPPSEDLMRKSIASLLLILQLSTPLYAGRKPPAARKALAITHVTIINLTGAPPEADMTVVIEGGHIAAVGKSKRLQTPKGAQEVDATGKFLIPGLWDMHTHIGDDDFDKRIYLPLFLANGVTGIRIMWGAPAHHLWRKEIESGTMSGPRMVIASRVIDGPKSFLSGAVVVRNEAEARDAVRQAKQEGADFVKVHDEVPRDAYFALVAEARRLRLPVEGHVPKSITAAESSVAGQKSIEHLTGLPVAEADSADAKALFASFKKNGTWQCPTLIMRHNYSFLNDVSFADDPRLKYVEASRRKRWLNYMSSESGKLSAGEWSRRQEGFRREEGLVGKMMKAGVGILAGTDNNNPYCLPGFSIHDELALLVEAGLTPAEALKAATLNPAKFLNLLDKLGTVEAGKTADMVVLDADPLEDIRNTKKVDAVVIGGRFLNRGTLDKMLAEVEAAVNQK
jgi:imidazolonepropionase-like amidohydrolase